MDQKNSTSPKIPLFVMLTLGGCAWLVVIFLLQQLGPWWQEFTVLPRHLDNWKGLLLSSSLHGSWAHLTGNMLALLTLGLLMGHLYPQAAWKALGIVWVTSFFFVWLFGAPNSSHLGASGLVYGLMSFAVCYPFFCRDMKALIGGLLVAIVFGSALWGLLPKEGVSFAGHLGGALGGFLSAWVLKPAKIKKDTLFKK